MMASSDAPDGDLAGLPGEDLMEQAHDLDPDAPMSILKPGVPYLATVRNMKGYGAFVNLTPPSGSDITGLMHKSNFPPMVQPRDFSEGDTVVVEVETPLDVDRPAFVGLYSPDADPGASLPGGVAADDAPADTEPEDEPEVETDADSEGNGESVPAVVQDIPAATEVLDRLQADGYTADEITTGSREGGDVVELDLTLKRGDA